MQIVSVAIKILGIFVFLVGFIPIKNTLKIWLFGKRVDASVDSVIRKFGVDSKIYEYWLSYDTDDEVVTVKWSQLKSIEYKKKHPQDSKLAIKYLKDNPESFIDITDKTSGIQFVVIMLLGLSLCIYAFFI